MSQKVLLRITFSSILPWRLRLNRKDFTPAAGSIFSLLRIITHATDGYRPILILQAFPDGYDRRRLLAQQDSIVPISLGSEARTFLETAIEERTENGGNEKEGQKNNR